MSAVSKACLLLLGRRRGRLASKASPPMASSKALNKHNHKIHALYVRQVGFPMHARSPCTRSKPHACPLQEFVECQKLVDSVLEESNNLCEYALFTKALIKRHNGGGRARVRSLHPAMRHTHAHAAVPAC